MINVTMIFDHGMSVGFQADDWADVYGKLKAEENNTLRPNRCVIAYAAESEWSTRKGTYVPVKSETFCATVDGLRSFGPNMRVVPWNGKARLFKRS